MTGGTRVKVKFNKLVHTATLLHAEYRITDDSEVKSLYIAVVLDEGYYVEGYAEDLLNTHSF